MKKVAFFVAAIGAANAFASIPDQIYALSESDRRSIFQKIMAPEDRRCAKVTNTFHQGSDKTGAGFWSVQCSGKAYQLMIENTSGGGTKLLDCETLKLVGSRCFAKFK